MMKASRQLERCLPIHWSAGSESSSPLASDILRLFRHLSYKLLSIVYSENNGGIEAEMSTKANMGTLDYELMRCICNEPLD